MNSIFEHFLTGEYVYTQTMMPVCEKHRLTFTELTVIMFLVNNPSLDTASDIVKCRKLAKSHVSTSVRSLEEKGLITKSYHFGDHRSVHLKVTETATPIVSDGRQAQKLFEEIIFDGISDAEKQLMKDIFLKMDNNIEKYAIGVNKNAK